MTSSKPVQTILLNEDDSEQVPLTQASSKKQTKDKNISMIKIVVIVVAAVVVVLIVVYWLSKNGVLKNNKRKQDEEKNDVLEKYKAFSNQRINDLRTELDRKNNENALLRSTLAEMNNIRGAQKRRPIIKRNVVEEPDESESDSSTDEERLALISRKKEQKQKANINVS